MRTRGTNGTRWRARLLLCSLGVTVTAALGCGTVTIPTGPLTVNQDPVANAGSDRQAELGTRVRLTGLSSTDADDDPLAYSWVQRSGPPVSLDNANSAEVSFLAMEAGSYEFTLTVTDGRGGSDVSSVWVFVDDELTVGGPRADAGADQVANEGAVVTLRGRNSADPEGGPLDYFWTQIEGPDVSMTGVFSPEPSFVAPEVATDTDLVFELSVTNENSLSDADTVVVTVRNLDGPGSSCAGVTCPEGQFCNVSTGFCESQDLCTGVTCPPGRTCNPATGACDGSADGCADGFCGPDENANNCAVDCGDEEDPCGDGICDSDEDAESCPGDCDEDEEPSCGDGACDEGEEAGNCPDDCEAFERFLDTMERARADRVSDAELGTVELGRGDTFVELNQAGDRRTEFTEVTLQKTKNLTNLVMTDNTIGKVYPGALLWAAPVRDGRLNQVERIPNRPPVTTSFTLLRNVAPRPTALTFEHDGSFSDFLAGAADVFDAVGSGGTRLIAEYKISSSLDDALLSIGLSAKFWGSSAQAGLEMIENRRRSVAVMTLDQVFYSAAVDVPSFEGFVPLRVIREDARLASALAESAERDGEIAYVRKVDYGRRILVSLSAEASTEELNIAIDTSIKVLSGEFNGELDRRTKEVWESVEGKIIIIGGSFPPGISGFFDGDMQSFVNTIKAIMSEDFVNDTHGALPVAFELAYANDNEPMQVFETIEFAGKIPGRSWGLVTKRESIFTDASNAAPIRSDNEINTDDWTMVRIDSQRLRLASDGRTVLFDLVWSAWEGEKNHTIRGDRTVIESRKTFTFQQPRPVSEIVSRTSFGPMDRWFSGRLPQVTLPFGNHGLLENIQVVVDGPGGHDSDFQRLDATLAFEVWLEE